ncbi:TetR/AcrR family transcriptional regulator [Rhodovulum sp. DZ06]|uniref:TetR/AcrR family transcriptional regulator n=1 Tax=Rhodovulum sp. DZ06 TaxID=3425126 RepID=UPI003D33162A
MTRTQDGSGASPGGKRGYHHGNLREALVETALAMIARTGPHGFSFAEVAREAGVSAAAPYRHFPSREALIAECARRGFALFADLLETAWNGGEPSPLTAFERVGRAYLAFARREPGYYISMFEAGLDLDSDPALRAEAERAQGAMRRASEELIARMAPEKAPLARMMSAHVWAMSHGVVELFERNSAGLGSPISPEELLESGTLVYLRGLGLIPGE